MYSLVRLIAVMAIILIIPTFHASAERLGPKACKSLTAKKNALVKAGAAKNMARGVKWAQKNLAAPALNDIRLFIETSEKLLFQCGHKTMRNVNLRNKPVPKKKTAKTKDKPDTKNKKKPASKKDAAPKKPKTGERADKAKKIDLRTTGATQKKVTQPAKRATVVKTEDFFNQSDR